MQIPEVSWLKAIPPLHGDGQVHEIHSPSVLDDCLFQRFLRKWGQRRWMPLNWSLKSCKNISEVCLWSTWQSIMCICTMQKHKVLKVSSWSAPCYPQLRHTLPCVSFCFITISLYLVITFQHSLFLPDSSKSCLIIDLVFSPSRFSDSIAFTDYQVKRSCN